LRLIDTHHHILPPFYVQALGADAIAAGLGGVPAWSPETSLAAMDRYGIDTAVASISNPGIAENDRKKAAALARQCNDFAKEMSVQHPGRFDAFAVLPMPDVDASLAEIKRALDDLRLAGIGLLTNYLGAYLGDPQFKPVLEELHRRKAVVFVHPTLAPFAPFRSLLPPPLVEFPHDTTWAIMSLITSGAFSRYPDIKFLFSHAGGTMLSIGLRFQFIKDASGGDSLALLKRSYYDVALSATPLTVPALLSFVGSSQVVFGSDYPFVPQPVLEVFGEYLAKLATERQDVFPLIERETALTLFPHLRR
jgi:predicted TIM-barrel fold metal-dependent hydrolase